MKTIAGLDPKEILKEWQDEGDADLVYRTLAELERDPKRREILLRLAEVERGHQEVYARYLREAGVEPGPYRPSGRARVLTWLARHGLAHQVMNIRLAEEANEVKALLEARTRGQQPPMGQDIAKDEAQHAEVLKGLIGRQTEPWHRIESGGFLRNAVYGFNDGLTANFGLVMGVVGAQVEPHIVLLSGLAGLVADALSMGSSGYLAAKSEQEVYRHELELERAEIQLMPALEAEELAIIYEAKGIPREAAHNLAREVVANPDLATQEMAREELGISTEFASPLRQGLLTGIATAFGAVIPILPFFFLSGDLATGLSFTISMLSHFLVGAARSFFTGRGVIRSGIDMFLVGLGVAIAGYVIGYLITGHIIGG